jgi:hypothetical protein
MCSTVSFQENMTQMGNSKIPLCILQADLSHVNSARKASLI